MKLIFIFLILLTNIYCDILPPIIFVPGLLGSSLKAKLDKQTQVNKWCSKKHDWYTIWAELVVFPPQADCWTDNMELKYEISNGTYHNTEGVEIDVNFDGSLDSMVFIYNKTWKLFEKLGYNRNKNLFAAVYDFRYGPNYNTKFMSQLKNLIETTYENNDQTKVILIGHSYGGHYSLTFLQNQSQEWKDKYIKLWIPVAPSIGGTMFVIQTLMFGFKATLPWLNIKNSLQIERSLQSIYQVLPSEDIFGDDFVFVKTPSKNYTMSNIDEFFNEIGYPIGGMKSFGQKQYRNDLRAPGVDTLLIMGNGTNTPSSGRFTQDYMQSDDFIIEYEDGDRVMPSRSLEYLQKWKNEQIQAYDVFRIEQADHTTLMQDIRVFQALKEYLDKSQHKIVNEI